MKQNKINYYFKRYIQVQMMVKINLHVTYSYPATTSNKIMCLTLVVGKSLYILKIHRPFTPFHTITLV